MVKCQIFILHWASSAHLFPNFFTAEAVRSIQELTKESYELIVVDNYSDDIAFKDLKDRLPSNVQIVRNDRSSACVASGRNKVFSLVDADYFAMLHTDIRVSRYWLTSLLADLDRAEKQFRKPCAISPLSVPYVLSDEKLYNRFSGHFTVNSLEGLVAYCGKHGIPFKDGVVDCEPQRPFTDDGHQLMMFAASKWFRDTVGEWDELYDGANYDDCDMGLTAITKGYKNLQSQTVFLQHLQGVSYGFGHLQNSGINQQRFIEKWGKPMFDELATGNVWMRLHRENP